MIDILIFSIATGLLSAFIVEQCFVKGGVFRKYHNIIKYHFELDRKTVKKHIEIKFTSIVGRKEKLSTTVVTLIPVFTKNPLRWFYNPLGGWVFCFGTWVYIVLYCAYTGLDANIIFGLGGNYLAILFALKMNQ